MLYSMYSQLSSYSSFGKGRDGTPFEKSGSLLRVPSEEAFGAACCVLCAAQCRALQARGLQVHLSHPQPPAVPPGYVTGAKGPGLTWVRFLHRSIHFES